MPDGQCIRYVIYLIVTIGLYQLPDFGKLIKSVNPTPIFAWFIDL